MNGPIKLVVPLFATLAIAACSGASSTVPAATGASTAGMPMVHSRLPQWLTQNLARPECAQVVGKPTCLALRVNGMVPNNTPSGWEPADLQARYNTPSSTGGKGVIVAIVDAYDNPDIASDLATYRSQFGLGKPKFTKFNQYGQTSGFPSGSSGWGTEEDLDVDMVSAVCPKCTIYLIEANGADTGDLETAEATAVTLGAHIISNSWICYGSSCGTSESSFDSPNVLYLAASGDFAYDENGPPEWFGSVVSVGGTQLAKSGSTYSESAWSDAGGGCSNNGSGVGQSKPKWQHDGGCTYRTDSDVSSEAGCAPGVAEYDTYGGPGWFQECGTSAASPLNAGVFALAGNASKLDAAKNFWTQKKKKYKRDLHDITTGSDGSCDGSYLCTAVKGYDGPTGWGSPNGIKAY
jgi:subtilase family serine protease